MTPTEQDKELREQVATIVEYWDFSPLQDEDTRIERLKNEILQLITAHTNKQVGAVLDRLESMAAYDPSGSSPVINPRQIEAERKRLKDELEEV